MRTKLGRGALEHLAKLKLDGQFIIGTQYKDIATQFDTTAGALRVAVWRLRKKRAKLLKRMRRIKSPSAQCTRS